MPVAGGRGFDFDVAVHGALARETQSLLVADAPEEQQRAGQYAEAFPQAWRADVVLTFGDQHFATAALAKAQAVDHFVWPPIQRDAVVERNSSQVAAGFDFDGLLLIDERDFGHDVLRFELLEFANGPG